VIAELLSTTCNFINSYSTIFDKTRIPIQQTIARFCGIKRLVALKDCNTQSAKKIKKE